MNRDHRPTVAIVGDASLEPDSEKAVLAADIARRLVDAGHRIVTGGLGGVMEAACRGARSSSRWEPGTSIGLLPGADPRLANAFVDVVVPTGLDHGRNLLVAQSDALVAVGGGAGTLSEISFAWIYGRLIVAMRCAGWSGRVADTRIDDRVRYAGVTDDRVFGATTAEEAASIVEARLPTFQRRHSGIGPPRRGSGT